MAKAATKSSRTNPKKNKSLAVRIVIEKNPSAGPTEVAGLVKKQFGHTVSPAVVSTIKAKAKGKKPGPKKATKVQQSPMQVMAHEALDTAFEFVGKVGGLLHAQALIDKLKAFKEGL